MRKRLLSLLLLSMCGSMLFAQAAVAESFGYFSMTEAFMEKYPNVSATAACAKSILPQIERSSRDNSLFLISVEYFIFFTV